MKKIRFFKTVCLTGMLGLLVGNVNAQSNIRVLNASDITCIGSGTCLNWTDSITGSPNPDPSLNVGGGYWNQTYYNTTGFGIGSFNLTHGSGESEYSYWSGFTSGANGDTRNYGYVDTTSHAGSINWVPNQWGIMAGGGLTTPPTVVKGAPYLIAYWDYFSDAIDPNAKSLQISLNGDSLFNLTEMYICNHPWPYYGNINGDGFARPLNQPGDYFKLYIHGVPNGGGTELLDSLTLEQYSTSAPNNVLQSPDWQYWSFARKGWNGLKSIYFTMKSTDELVIGDINYGPNTAVYFCLDKVKVTKTGSVASSSSVQKVQSATDNKSVQITDYFPIASYSGGEVIVFNENSKEVLHTNVKAGDKINLSDLPNGNYRLKHGSKIISISKISKGGK
jgi:hypothetical protein